MKGEKSITVQSFYYDSIDSTMDEAKRLIKTGLINNIDIAYVVATHQTKGRGTFGKSWSSPPEAGIYLSIIHLPKKGNLYGSTTLYTLSAGIACIEAIKQVTGILAYIKPINDIYYKNKKLGGILIECKSIKNGITKLITGIGINTHKAKRIIEDSNIEPVSLEEILPQKEFQHFSREELIKMVVSKVSFWHNKVFNNEYEEIKELWEKFTAHTT